MLDTENGIPGLCLCGVHKPDGPKSIIGFWYKPPCRNEGNMLEIPRVEEVTLEGEECISLRPLWEEVF